MRDLRLRPRRSRHGPGRPHIHFARTPFGFHCPARAFASARRSRPRRRLSSSSRLSLRNRGLETTTRRIRCGCARRPRSRSCYFRHRRWPKVTACRLRMPGRSRVALPRAVQPCFGLATSFRRRTVGTLGPSNSCLRIRRLRLESGGARPSLERWTSTAASNYRKHSRSVASAALDSHCPMSKSAQRRRSSRRSSGRSQSTFWPRRSR